MEKELRGQFDRIEELCNELKEEYERCLHQKEVSEKAKNVTSEVLTKIRSVLDHIMWRIFEKYNGQSLSQEKKEKVKVYFPIRDSEDKFNSSLKSSKLASLSKKHKVLYDFLLSIQPFKNNNFQWLTLLNKFAIEGKHIRLTPQKRFTQERVTVEGKSGKVSWNPSSVRFGRGVKVTGAPVDPNTQNIVPTPGVTSRKETWVSFQFEDSTIDAFLFCRDCLEKARNLAEDLLKLI